MGQSCSLPALQASIAPHLVGKVKFSKEDWTLRRGACQAQPFAKDHPDRPDRLDCMMSFKESLSDVTFVFIRPGGVRVEGRGPG